MQIGEVIRKYRKEKNFTQEELANRLGVSAPAVNKWERGTSQPDMMLLAPLARLLEISLETLLSFHETLTTEEIAAIINEVDKRFAEHDFDNVFQYALGIIQQYPNCNQLIWQLAVVFNARIITDKSICQEKYEPQILKWFHQHWRAERRTYGGTQRIHCLHTICGKRTIRKRSSILLILRRIVRSGSGNRR